jgi:CheY-like chemotaxis protein
VTLVWILVAVAVCAATAVIVALSNRLKRAQADLRSRDDRFAAVSHELRGPLQPIALAVSRLKREEQLSAKGGEAVATIERNVEAELRLIEDLWDVTRGDRPLSMRPSACDTNEVLREVTESARSRAAGKRVELDLVLDPAAPHAIADPIRLRQIVRNLVENAIKFTPPGGRVTVRSDRGGGQHVVVSVTDTGVGIPRELQERIFKPYAQLEAGKEAGGLGIGLHLARKLAEAQGGAIELKSGGIDQGSTFTLSLPRASSAAAAHAADGADARGMRILLAEDHEDSARLIGELLQARGYVVLTVGSLASGIAAAERSPFDVLISDIELPDGSGLDLMRRMRMTGDVRGIALSGRRTETDRAESRSAGFAAHLLKPIDFEALLSAIDEVRRS